MKEITFADAVNNNLAKVNKLISHSKGFQFKLLNESWEKEVNHLYNEYKAKTRLPKEFLAIPKEKNVSEVLQSDKKWYLGIVLNDGALAGVAKVYQCTKVEEFFQPPLAVAQKKPEAVYYGISGLLVDEKYKGHGFGKALVNQALAGLHFVQADGVYADCDFRNIASFKTLSKQMNFVGFTDGRQGGKDEQTLYTTFFYEKPRETTEQANLTLDFSDTYSTIKGTKRYDGAEKILKNTLQSMGDFEEHKVSYEDGYNSIYVLKQPISTVGINLQLGRWANEMDNQPKDVANVALMAQFNSNKGR